MSGPERLRLFVAVSVPRTHLGEIERAAEPLRERLPGGRWTKVENQHVTLKFLGWTPAADLPRVEEVCAGVAIRHAPATIEVGGIGSFPTRTRVRVLWVGLHDGAGLLRTLAGGLDEGFAALGIGPEDRPFTAHLTLARFKSPVRVPAGLPELELPQLPPFRVETVELYRSFLSPKGARYEVVRSFPLGR